jgi:hypothetical protein
MENRDNGNVYEGGEKGWADNERSRFSLKVTPFQHKIL